MLLSYIDFLIDHNQHYNNTYSIYEGLVEEWLNREMRKGISQRQEPLAASLLCAGNEFVQNKEQTISAEEVRLVCEGIEGIQDLEYMTIEGRSLLHRTSEGSYKFAHYSILEFFVATVLRRHQRAMSNSDQVISFIADLLASKKLKKAVGMDLRRISLKGAVINKVDFSRSSLKEANFEGSAVNESKFVGADLTRSNFSNCSLVLSDFGEANCKDIVLRNANLSRATVEELDFSHCDMQKAVLSQSPMSKAVFSHCNLESADLSCIESSDTSFDKAHLANSNWENTAIRRINFAGADLSRANLARAISRMAIFWK